MKRGIEEVPRGCFEVNAIGDKNDFARSEGGTIAEDDLD